MGDIDPLEINDELKQFVVIVRKNKHFPTYICLKQLLNVHPNLCIALPSFADMPTSLGDRC